MGPDCTEVKLHMNVLEIMTIVKALDVLEDKEQTLAFWSDNRVAISVILRLGTHSPYL